MLANVIETIFGNIGFPFNLEEVIQYRISINYNHDFILVV